MCLSLERYEMEYWRVISEFSNWEISNKGRVRNRETHAEKTIKRIGHKGPDRLYVQFCYDGVRYSRRLSDLMDKHWPGVTL